MSDKDGKLLAIIGDEVGKKSASHDSSSVALGYHHLSFDLACKPS